MCKLSGDCEILFITINIVGSLGRLILSSLIAFESEFTKELIILSIFSLLCAILISISIIFLFCAFSYADHLDFTYKGRRYIIDVDLEKEGWENTKERWNNQDFWMKFSNIVLYISYIFSIGVIEETIRIGNFKSDYCIFNLLVTIIEIISQILYKSLEYLESKEKK